jgi:hypothetical protein
LPPKQGIKFAIPTPNNPSTTYMKNLLFSSLLLLLALNTLTAQREKYALYSWGPEEKRIKNAFIDNIVGANGDGAYITQRQQGLLSTEKFTLEAYNPTLKKTKTTELELQFDDKKRTYQSVITLGKKLWLLSTFNNTKLNKNFLFADPIDLKTLKNKPSKTFKIAEAPALNKTNEGSFSLDFSRDSSKLLIYNTTPFQGNLKKEKIGVTVLDTAMNTLWTKNIELPYEDAYFLLSQYIVDNEGNVYLLGRHYEEKYNIFRFREQRSSFVLIAYRNNGTQVKEYRIGVGDDYISDLVVEIADDGALICSGFYSERNSNSFKGTCYLRINPQTEKVIHTALKPFSPEFIQQFQQRAVSQRGELGGFQIRHFTLRTDGGALMVAEHYREEIRTNYDPRTGTSRSYITYYNLDVIVVNINPDGTIAWNTKIPKYQRSSNADLYASIAIAQTNSKTYIIFNDDPKKHQHHPIRQNSQLYRKKIHRHACRHQPRRNIPKISPLHQQRAENNHHTPPLQANLQKRNACLWHQIQQIPIRQNPI